jgi:tRNA U34 5-methylaminomethyl-2-thiouridine-forming methyltransferase MnmC
MNPFMSEFELITLKSGLKSLRSLERQETFHPTSGPMSEARLLHVEQQRLVERSSQVGKFVIWDVGFGAAANVLSAIEALIHRDAEIEIHSFDKTTAPMEFALHHAHELKYVLDFQHQIRELLTQRQVQISPRMQWYLHLGDFSTQIKDEYKNLNSPHAVFYDPYSSATNPEMWTLENFSYLNHALNSNTPCLWTNYTRSTAVRVALLLAGFYVGVGRSVGEKAETTVASNDLGLLEKPLTLDWLNRVRNSTNSAPLRAQVYSKSKISEADFERLKMLPQFRLR